MHMKEDSQKDRQTDRQTYRQTDMQAGRAGRQTGRQAAETINWCQMHRQPDRHAQVGRQALVQTTTAINHSLD